MTIQLLSFWGVVFTEGFSIHFDGDLTEIVSKNLLSAIQQPAVVEAKLSKEIDAAGTYSFTPD